MRRTQDDFRFEAPVRMRAELSLYRTARRLRAFCAPEHLLLGMVLVLGWAALIAWTGNGPAGWQARFCADADAALAACRVTAPMQDGKVL